eukprot:7785-Heterococcus_DN1.PRE.5
MCTRARISQHVFARARIKHSQHPTLACIVTVAVWQSCRCSTGALLACNYFCFQVDAVSRLAADRLTPAISLQQAAAIMRVSVNPATNRANSCLALQRCVIEQYSTSYLMKMRTYAGTRSASACVCSTANQHLSADSRLAASSVTSAATSAVSYSNGVR